VAWTAANTTHNLACALARLRRVRHRISHRAVSLSSFSASATTGNDNNSATAAGVGLLALLPARLVLVALLD
jgi:hypothetical protein